MLLCVPCGVQALLTLHSSAELHPELAQRVLLALFYTLLHQEHTWDKLEQAGFKGLPRGHVSFPVQTMSSRQSPG